MQANKHWILQYASAILFCGLALAFVYATPLRAGSPFLIFIGAVVLTARYGGLGPALLATLLGSVVSAYFFLAPTFSLAVGAIDGLRLAAFIVISLLISSLTASREPAQQAATMRARQQAAVAELGQYALTSRDIPSIFDRASELVCETLGVEYCKVLELLPGGTELLLRAGHGWKEGLVGHATVDAGLHSQAGYAFTTREPVIVRDLRKEKRFTGSSLLMEHNVVSGMSVLILEQEVPFGILGAHTTHLRKFSEDDIHFLQAIANVLAAAIARAKTEAQVREQRNWLGVTLASIGDGVIATDAEGRITLMNSVAQFITGWKLEDAKGRPIGEVLQLQDEKTGESLQTRITSLTQVGLALASGDHTLLTTKHGSVVPVDFHAAPIQDDQGSGLGAVLTFRDVSERRQSERALQESEERYRTVAETASDAIVTIDAQSKIRFVNRAAEQIFGYASEELIGQDLEILMPEDQREAAHRGIRRYLETGQKHLPWKATELPGRHKSGRTIPLEIALGEFRRDGERLVTGIIRDITERRKVQDQLEFQATILQNVRDAIIVTNNQGQVIYWNKGAQTIFGYAAEEMLGQSLQVLYPDVDEAAFRADLERIASGADYIGEWKGTRKDGSVVWVDIKTTLFRDAAGVPIGFIGVSSDITERKLAEERLAAQYRITRVLAESETLGEATPKLLRAVCEIANWEVGALWVPDPEADVLRCLEVWHVPAINIAEFERLTREMLFPRDVGLPGRVWASRAPAWIPDITEETNFPRGKVASKNGLRGSFAFPITSGDRLTGVLEFLSRDTRQPDARLLDMMSSLGSQIGQFIERKRAEEALRLSREQQAIILRGVADGVTAQGPNGELSYANDAAAELIGFSSPEELLATPIAEIISRFEVSDEQGQPLTLEQLPGKRAIVERRHVEQLLRFRARPEGEEHWLFVRATPVQDDQGYVQFAISIFHDVTASRHAEQQTREQSELLRVTLASIGDGVISTDTQGKVNFMNPVAESLTGWTTKDAMGQSLDQVFRILNGETGAVVESPVSRVLRERQVIQLSGDTLLIARNGKRIAINDSGAPILDAQGNLIGIVLTFRDITEERQAEQAVSHLAAVVQSTDDAVLTTTVEGIVQTWNPGAEALYGYTAEEIIGRSIMITYPPDHQGEFREIIERLKRREPATHFDTARIRKDGRRIDVSITVSPLRDAAGRLVGVSKIARDITEHKRAERAERFLAEAGDLLASSLDYETTLKSVAQLAVPQIADWCAVDLQAEDGTIQPLVLAHVDPNKVSLAFEFQKKYPPNSDAPSGSMHVIRTGKPELVRYISDDQLAAAGRNKEHLDMLLELNPRSFMVVPLTARGRTLGAITLVSSESGRRYDEIDLALAQELARRVALAVENARLFRQAQALNEELERRVVNRTIELRNANRRLENEINERQKANEQLRLLSGHLQSAREDERIRVAREIHDEIGQVLTAVKMDLSLLDREVAKEGTALTPDHLHEQLGSTKNLVDQAIDTMHGIVRELRPEILDHLGLRAAIEWQLQEFQSRTQIACQFDCAQDEVELDQERAIAVFRILQETLTNVVRHAGATQVQVLLSQQDHHLLLQVQDNGKGIDPDKLEESKTFGILGMRERAHVFGGNVAITGTPGQGTVVSVQIPL